MSSSETVTELTVSILAVTNATPRVLTISLEGNDALPFGPFDPSHDRTLEIGLRRWVASQAGINLGYVEQLYTFGNRNRDPREIKGGPRVITVAYIALAQESSVGGAHAPRWHDWYAYLPWEDWREGKPEILDRSIAPALKEWVKSAESVAARKEREEKVDINFSLWGAPWVDERSLERFELLYEAGLVQESIRDRRAGGEKVNDGPKLGAEMAHDHRRILASAIGRIRGKIRYRPVVFELLPPRFTLYQLQLVVEALAGKLLHKANFRRTLEDTGVVEGTGETTTQTGGRPAELFTFRREVVRERPAPGVRA